MSRLDRSGAWTASPRCSSEARLERDVGATCPGRFRRFKKGILPRTVPVKILSGTPGSPCEPFRLSSMCSSLSSSMSRDWHALRSCWCWPRIPAWSHRVDLRRPFGKDVFCDGNAEKTFGQPA